MRESERLGEPTHSMGPTQKRPTAAGSASSYNVHNDDTDNNKEGSCGNADHYEQTPTFDLVGAFLAELR